MKKILAMAGTLALAGGLAFGVVAPASAATACKVGGGDSVSGNYAWTTDANGYCGKLGAQTYFSPSPGIEHLSTMLYSNTNYVSSYHLAYIMYGIHFGANG